VIFFSTQTTGERNFLNKKSKEQVSIIIKKISLEQQYSKSTIIVLPYKQT
jgi:hypothetical protein